MCPVSHHASSVRVEEGDSVAIPQNCMSLGSDMLWYGYAFDKDQLFRKTGGGTLVSYWGAVFEGYQLWNGSRGSVF